MTLTDTNLDNLAEEAVVMTPLIFGESMVVRVEKLPPDDIDFSLVQHVAGGPYTGIYVNKAVKVMPSLEEPQVSAGLRAYLVDPEADDPDVYYLEERVFRFWFRDGVNEASQVATAEKFFQEVCDPEEFPRDYTSFARRVLLLTRKFLMIRKVELELIPVNEESALSDSSYMHQQEVLVATTMSTLSTEDAGRSGRKGAGVRRGPSFKKLVKGPSFREKLTPSKRGRVLIWIAKKQKVLNILENAFPNSLAAEELVRIAGFRSQDLLSVSVILKGLQSKGLISEVASGSWMRIPTSTEEHGQTHEIKVVKNLPQLSGSEQPTIAIVTLLYCEKLAVDAMMDRKTTYVRFKTEGESLVYTVGMIGPHKVVSTKLARVGSGKGAMISAGNVITRLSGTFNKVEHVLLVGCGGGVPDYNDYSKHTRLGDVVISQAENAGDVVYMYCQTPDKGMSFDTRGYAPSDPTIHEVINRLRNKYENDAFYGRPWEAYMDDALRGLGDEGSRFEKPPSKTDRLYKVVDANQIVEVEHPTAPDSVDGAPKLNLRYGLIACGNTITRRDDIRQEFAVANNIKAYDCDFQAVFDSIEGNRKDSFVVIRGIADYVDGSRKKDWQPYSSLAAAAYMKALILSFPYDEPLTP
ncbi:uncharacterized protein LOC106154834 [Lingula anatina]|uniref:Uncharacterized protein LOC106154834 n=1 Tax=Lingula anatina TaxID=7574 RepID=A0A1S3HH22_LINAN|nr:uncharacterized protein LOC106154834 [Lingula anatina]|eukprot:XP_013384796.1 uncharacterized protein LOC106154834 [Lingula anatina]